MNKADLVAKVAELSGLSKANANKASEAVFDAITAALKAGDDVRLIGFGSFSVSARPARQGKNPRTGEMIAIPASKAPKFSVGILSIQGGGYQLPVTVGATLAHIDALFHGC